MEAEHPVFLDMEWRTSKFPHYYLMTLVYKLPHSTQILLLWAIIAAVLSRSGEAWRRRLWLLLPAAVLVIVASTSGMQLGIRYILPALPLLFLFISEIAAKWSWPKSRWPQIAVAVLLLLFDPWHVHPEYLAYFNEVAGGGEGGRTHLLDSNLDWGQDLHELQRFMRDHPIQDLHLAYFGTMPPEALGIRYTPPPSRSPQPGWHVVSVNFVMGRPHGIRDGRGDEPGGGVYRMPNASGDIVPKYARCNSSIG